MTAVKNSKIEALDMLKQQIHALDMGTAADEMQHAPCNHIPRSEPTDLLSYGFHECLGAEREDFAAVCSFALAASAVQQRRNGRQVLLCRFRRELQEYGDPYACGLEALGLPVERLLCVDVKKEQELYWVGEEALASDALAAVVIIGASQEKAYNFTASRRLKLRSESTETPLYFVRHWNQAGNTAAHARWRVSRRLSREEVRTASRTALIGETFFSLQLEKPISSGSQSWELSYDATGGFSLVQPLANRPSRKAGGLSRAA